MPMSTMLYSRPLVLSAVVSLSSTVMRPVACLSTSTSRIENLSLFQSLDKPKGATFPVYNPAEPSQVVANVPINTRDHVAQAIKRSEAALPHWRDETTVAFRASLLTKWSQLIQEHKNDIATIMTLEAGKPLKESLGEVNYGTSFLDYYAAEALRPAGTLIPTAFANPDGSPKGQAMVLQQAVGVTGLIAPWNFPIAMITRKVGPALAAGCTALVKPSELTPVTAMLLQELADQAGIPEGVVQTITTDRDHTPEVGDELCTNPSVKKISFTGSTPVGKLLMETSASTVKRLSLELGGNAPFIVFEDADMDQAVASAMGSKFRNAGQTCVCADRFLVHSSRYEEFVDRMSSAIDDLVIGDGMDENVTMGPVISAQACDGIDQKVQDAIAAGAKCVAGGSKLALGSHFYAPTLLVDVPRDSDIWKTETFGPVAAVRSFDTEEEAIEIANDCSVGLASYFLTKDLGRTFRVAKALETGLVGVNEGVMSTCTAPFGGVKESGLGREGSTIGLQEYVESKYVFINY